jgi:hypothetical protein
MSVDIKAGSSFTDQRILIKQVRDRATSTAKKRRDIERFFFAYLGELLKLGVFKHIYVPFLPLVISTKTDQLFSQFAATEEKT